MTDKEIIKAFEHCRIKKDCKKCPLERTTNCMPILFTKVFNLLNRYEAEIERLKKNQKDIDDFARDLCRYRMVKGKATTDFEDLEEYIKDQNAEAIKEFAERLKVLNKTRIILWDEHIDNLVKEMTEGQQC